mgnify:CR=1 FL=1
MKIIFVGDSMGLPREGCEYEDTYFYKFQKEYKEIDCISFFKRAMTSDGLYELYESYIRHYNPDIVISHSGLTDCAPRLINDRKYFWRGLIYVSKRLGRLNLFWLIIKKIFERNDPKRAYISVNEFRKNYIAFTEKLINIGVKKIVYIKISPCGQNVVRKSPLLNDNVAKYNKVFDERFDLYGIDTAFCNMINKMKFNYEISISIIEHDLSHISSGNNDFREVEVLLSNSASLFPYFSFRLLLSVGYGNLKMIKKLKFNVLISSLFSIILKRTIRTWRF